MNHQVPLDREDFKKLERRLSRRENLLAALFYVPLITIAALVLIGFFLFRPADRIVGRVSSVTGGGHWSTGGSQDDAVKNIVNAAEGTRRAFDESNPYGVQPRQDFDYARLVDATARELTAIRNEVLPKDSHVAPGEIAAAVAAMKAQGQRGGPLQADSSGGCSLSIADGQSAYPIFFNFGRADLTPVVRTQLESIIRMLRRTTDRSTVTVSGFADITGTARGNESLRERRAQAVSEFLRTKSGGEISPKIENQGNKPPSYPCFSAGDEYLRVTVIRIGA
jgi:outer membrane protein OmpA-like peptidoglycan-associated protein